MLGWRILIHKELQDKAPGQDAPKLGPCFASWLGGLGGAEWLDQLVKKGKASELSSTGYPCSYASKAKYILPLISSKPPGHDGSLVIGDDYVLPGGWLGEVTIDYAEIAKCLPDDRLIIEAWDQS